MTKYNRSIGTVIKVYIPENKEKDYLENNMIGFLVEVEGKLIVIEEEQDEYNTEILKGDTVAITEISDRIYIDKEEEYE